VLKFRKAHLGKVLASVKARGQLIMAWLYTGQKDSHNLWFCISDVSNLSL